MAHKRNRRKVRSTRNVSGPTAAETDEKRYVSEEARRLLETVNAFPISVNSLGEIELGNNATGIDLKRFEAYYEEMEMIVMEEANDCPCRSDHITLDADQFRLFVIATLMRRLRVVGGRGGKIDALWMPGKKTRVPHQADPTWSGPTIPWSRRNVRKRRR